MQLRHHVFEFNETHNIYHNVTRIRPSNNIRICLWQTSVVSPLTVETPIH